MRFLVFLVFLGHLFICCRSNNNDPNEQNIETDQTQGLKNITLIFDKAPKENFISLINDPILGGRSYFTTIASYRDSDGTVHTINPKRKPFIDTVKISFNKPKIEIYFERLGLEGHSYLFNNGDKILVSYKNNKPNIEILNRTVRPYDYSFENFKTKERYNTLTPYERFFKYLPYPNIGRSPSKAEYQEFLRKKSQENSILLTESLKTQKELLDSLSSHELMSKDIHHYYSDKLLYIYLSMLTKLKAISFPSSEGNETSIEGNFIDRNLLRKLVLKNYNTEIIIENTLKSGDSLLMYNYFHNFLIHSFLPNYIENQTTKTTYSYGNFGGSHYSWDAVFDTIQKSDLYSPKVKQFLLYLYMDKISQDLSPETAQVYYGKFVKFNSNSTYIDLINSKYGIDSTSTNKLMLMDEYHNKFYLEDIIEDNVGKVIFIDFWASWCKPCIDAIPYKKRLVNDYNNKKIIFVSIATDKDEEKWKVSNSFKAQKNFPHNYILKKPLLSKFIKEHHLNYIPRYMVLNKKGSVINPNAPAPETDEIRELLDKYLNE
ncbi:TlpA disulfide reductase family protein [Algibacter sp. 2305UL17-15]|uniref:TlpA family protein disulfide reductase n=1 Tax=Algibacter sp. 2305UL17-15 TaxID=3231268 RepID=UPI003458ED2B